MATTARPPRRKTHPKEVLAADEAPNIWMVRLRTAAHLSQEELGAMLRPQISQQSISKMESSAPPVHRAVQIAVACGAPPTVAEAFKAACVRWREAQTWRKVLGAPAAVPPKPVWEVK